MVETWGTKVKQKPKLDRNEIEKIRQTHVFSLKNS